jgi:hypothetical protein
MKIAFGWALLAGLALITGCAPAARQSPQQSVQARGQAALPRFTVKTGETWQLTAFRPGNVESQRFPLELFGAPEVDDEGDLFAEAEADRFNASLYFFPEDDTLLVFVPTSGGNNPDLVLCFFENAGAGKNRYEGESFFGKLNELRDGRPPQARFANCVLEKK